MSARAVWPAVSSASMMASSIGAMATGPVTGAPGCRQAAISTWQHGPGWVDRNQCGDRWIRVPSATSARPTPTGCWRAASLATTWASSVFSTAIGNVSAGNFSQVGGFAGTNTGSDCSGCGGMGIAFEQCRLDPGLHRVWQRDRRLFQPGGRIYRRRQHDHQQQRHWRGDGRGQFDPGRIRGLARLRRLHQDSTSSGPVTATGPNTWAGGFVGANIGMIFNSTTSSSVSGTSNSVLGGFAGVNVGWIDPSFASGAVQSSGGGNFIGGFVGLNFGTIDNANVDRARERLGAPTTSSAACWRQCHLYELSGRADSVLQLPDRHDQQSRPVRAASVRSVSPTRPRCRPRLRFCDVRRHALRDFPQRHSRRQRRRWRQWRAGRREHPQHRAGAGQCSQPGAAEGQHQSAAGLDRADDAHRARRHHAAPGPAAARRTYSNARPGQPGFTPPPFPQRLGPDGWCRAACRRPARRDSFRTSC